MYKLKYSLFILISCWMTSSIAQVKNTVSSYPIHAQYKNSNKPIVIFLTGDGGWNSFSIDLANELNSLGYPVISLDTRKYFWSQKTPAQFGKDMNVIMDYYGNAWKKNSFAVVGYSFGAEVAAFLPANLDQQNREQVKSLVLLSPGYSNSFVVRFINMFSTDNTNKDKYKVYPELLKINVPVLCIFGEEETTDISKQLKDTHLIRKITIPGAHHYQDNVKEVAKNILKGL
jgi:type IV secretory pathway VirJ component